MILIDIKTIKILYSFHVINRQLGIVILLNRKQDIVLYIYCICIMYTMLIHLHNYCGLFINVLQR